jgi:Protein of unknown function (DUF1214)
MGDKHLFHPNDLKRYSLGTKNKNLKRNVDGSLTLYAGAKSPGAEKETNRRRVDISRSTSAPIGARWASSKVHGSRRSFGKSYNAEIRAVAVWKYCRGSVDRRFVDAVLLSISSALAGRACTLPHRYCRLRTMIASKRSPTADY